MTVDKVISIILAPNLKPRSHRYPNQKTAVLKSEVLGGITPTDHSTIHHCTVRYPYQKTPGLKSEVLGGITPTDYSTMHHCTVRYPYTKTAVLMPGHCMTNSYVNIILVLFSSQGVEKVIYVISWPPCATAIRNTGR